MGDSWQDAVVLITSRADGNNTYGTGFVVHRDERGTYVLTCTHVVDDVGGKECVNVNDTPAMVIESDPADGIDVTILCVVGLAHVPLLRPRIVNFEISEAIELAGYYHLDDNPKKKLVFRPLSGKFSSTIRVGMAQKSLVPFWEIEITSNNELRPGNSGSPIVNKDHYVIGIVNTRTSLNKKIGWVTPIHALKEVWQEIPPNLFVGDEEQLPLQDKSKLLHEYYETMRKALQENDVKAVFYAKGDIRPIQFKKAREAIKTAKNIIQDANKFLNQEMSLRNPTGATFNREQIFVTLSLLMEQVEELSSCIDDPNLDRRRKAFDKFLAVLDDTETLF